MKNKLRGTYSGSAISSCLCRQSNDDLKFSANLVIQDFCDKTFTRSEFEQMEVWLNFIPANEKVD